MKKNYAYAYKTLQKTGKNAKKLLPKSILVKIDDSKLNYNSLDSLNKALELLGHYTYTREETTSIIIDHSLPETTQLQNYQMQVISSGDRNTSFSLDEMNFKIAERNLERYQSDFYQLLSDIYKNIKMLCIENNSEELKNLLSENIWMKDMLADYNGELGILMAQQGKKDILEIIYPQLQEYKQNMLSVAAENNQESCVKYLLDQGADPIPLLKTNNYYKNTVIADLFIDSLYQQNLTKVGNYHKGRCLYEDNKFEDAIKVFEDVDDNSPLFIHALYFKGLCYQHSKQYQLAKEVFQNVQELSNITEIKIKAEQGFKNVELLISQEKRTEQTKTNILSSLEKAISNTLINNEINQEFKKDVVNFCDSLEKLEHSEITKKYKCLEQKLNKAKYIEIGNNIDNKILIASKFENIPSLFKQYVPNSEEEKKYQDYKNAIDIVDETLKLIGEISQGLVIEDY